MKEVIRLFKQIQETSSTNDKKAIIAANKDNELFKKCLVFLLDGNINTGISNKKINKKVEPSSELAPYYLCMNSTFEKVMDYLIKNNTGTDADIYEIQCFLIGHEEDREFYEQMITKSFRLGALVVDYNGNKVKVGSGYSDEERVNFWNDRDKYIGRVITVKYKEISKDKKTGLESLQFPVYCGMRDLGKEPSYD